MEEEVAFERDTRARVKIGGFAFRLPSPPRFSDRIFRERGFYRRFLIEGGTRGGYLVCVEGCPWRRVLFRETDLFRGCAWPLSDMRQEYKRAWRKGDARTGRDVFARSKEGRIRGIYMYFPFVCDPLDTDREEYGVWRKEEKSKEGKRKKKRKRKWSRGAMVDLRHPSPLLSSSLASFRPASRRNSRPGSSTLPSPPTFVRHFSSGTLARQSYSAITFIQPLFHSFNLVALYKESLSSLSLSLSSYHILSLTPSNSFRCRHPASSRIGKCAPWRIGKEGWWRRPSARPTLEIRGEYGYLLKEVSPDIQCRYHANQKLENSVFPSIFARNIRIFELKSSIIDLGL